MEYKRDKEYPNKYWFKRYIYYNPLTGEFTRIQRGANGAAAGPIKNKLGKVRVNGEVYMLSVIAWIYMTGKRPPTHILHKDGDLTNFKFDNLGSKPLMSYARKQRGRWTAYFYLPNDRQQYYAGRHDTEEDAITAAQAAAMMARLKQKENDDE